MSPVTLDQARKASAARTFPADLIQGDTASAKPKPRRAARSLGGDAYPLGPASISELARSLRNNVDLIYQYLRNNVVYYPIWGVQKGALGTVLDNAGTDFDQSALMVELLRASGYTANYVRGVITLNAQQFKEWYGYDTGNVCAVLGMLAQSQIPVASINATSAGSCPSPNAAMTDVSIEHVWVKVNTDGTSYVFDPSYKPHALVEGIDVAAASGYNASTFLSTATSGAAITPDYVQNLNRSGIQSTLKTQATTLANWLRTNKPTAGITDVLGGRVIVPYLGSTLRQATLPYQNTAYNFVESTTIDPGYKPTVRIVYQGIDKTFTWDAIYGTHQPWIV